MKLQDIAVLVEEKPQGKDLAERHRIVRAIMGAFLVTLVLEEDEDERGNPIVRKYWTILPLGACQIH